MNALGKFIVAQGIWGEAQPSRTSEACVRGLRRLGRSSSKEAHLTKIRGHFARPKWASSKNESPKSRKSVGLLTPTVFIAYFFIVSDLYDADEGSPEPRTRFCNQGGMTRSIDPAPSSKPRIVSRTALKLFSRPCRRTTRLNCYHAVQYL